MMDEYSNGDLMAAIIDLKKATELGFERVNTRLDDHDERFTRIDERFTHIDERFTRIDERFDRIDARFDRMDKRFDELGLVDRSHERRIQRLEDRVFDRPAP